MKFKLPCLISAMAYLVVLSKFPMPSALHYHVQVIRLAHANLSTYYSSLNTYYHSYKIHELFFYCGCYLDK